MGKTVSMHNFGRRTPGDDTPGEITGGLLKCILQNCRPGTDRIGVARNMWPSFCFECILMNFTISYRQKIS